MAGEATEFTPGIAPIGPEKPTEVTELRIDPDLTGLIPPLNEGEYAALYENISKYGCRDPLTVWNGRKSILDGHNRYKICKELDLPFKVVEIELPDLTAAKIWMIKNQRGRRNLNESQRAMLAVVLEALYAEQAKNRMGTRTDLGKKLDPSEAGRSADKAAKDMGVSHQTVIYAKKVAENGIQELVDLAKSGKVAVSAAAKATALDHPLQGKLVERIEEKVKEGKHPKVGAIIREIAPKEAKDYTQERFDKVGKNLRACLKLLEEVEVAENQEMVAEIQGVVQKIVERLKVVGGKSPDPSSNNDDLDPADAPGTEIKERQKATGVEANTISEEPEQEAAEKFYPDHEGANLPEGWGDYEKAIAEEG